MFYRRNDAQRVTQLARRGSLEPGNLSQGLLVILAHFSESLDLPKGDGMTQSTGCVLGAEAVSIC